MKKIALTVGSLCLLWGCDGTELEARSGDDLGAVEQRSSGGGGTTTTATPTTGTQTDAF